MNIEKTEIDDVYIVKNLLSKEQHAAIYNCICYFTRWDFNTCTQNPLHPIEDINGQSYFSKMFFNFNPCLLYTSPSPRDATLSRMPSSA